MASFSDTIVLYHHTDSVSAALIKKYGYIKQSGGGRDAVFGDGVYLTELGPSDSSSMVAKNNYDNVTKVWTNMLGKTEVAIRIVIKKSEVKQCPGDRNVYLYTGDLDLSKVVDWDVISRE